MECKGTFCFVSPQDSIAGILRAMSDFNVNIVLSEKCFFEKHPIPNEFSPICEVTIVGHQIVAFQVKGFQHVSPTTHKDIMFAGRTSGSTGQAKIIHVPYTCFWPNIDSIR